MPKVSDEAIVLRLLPHGESDLIVHLLTLSRGRRSVLARAARKSRKRFAGALQPFSHIRTETTIRRTQSLGRLDSAESIHSFMSLRESLEKIYLGSYFCDLLDNLLMEGEQYPEVFELMLYFLDRLREHEAGPKHRLFFEIRLMDLLGFRPDFDCCGVEGHELDGDCWFDPRHQMPIGREAAQFVPDALPLSAQARRALIAACECPLYTLSDVRLGVRAAREAQAVTRALVLGHLGRRPKSLDMLEGVLEP